MSAERRPTPENLGQRRIVVTGIGMVTPLGLDSKTTWSNLIEGKSGISPINIDHTVVRVGGKIDNFDPKIALAGVVLPKDLRRISRPAQLSTAAAAEALKNAGLITSDNKLKDGIDPTRVGVRVGTGIGGATLIFDVSKRIESNGRVTPFDTLLIEPERVASVVSMKLGLKGPLEMPSAACATGNIAISGGYKEILLNDADVMVVGGVESALDSVALSLFDAVGALSHEDPVNAARASRPFDKSRNGFVMSEGAGILILEEREHAIKRGARILAEMVGYGNTADAGGDTDPTGEGAERAMKEAIKRSGLPENGTIYVNAHATSTPAGDPVEMKSIRNVFREENLIVSSTKGATGHLMGGAGGVEAAFSVLALSEGVLPPTINLKDPMDEASGVNLVPNEAQKKQPDMSVNNAFGFGGFNSVTVFKRAD